MWRFLLSEGTATTASARRYVRGQDIVESEQGSCLSLISERLNAQRFAKMLCDGFVWYGNLSVVLV